MPAAVVCLPTYNERENLEAMLRALGDKGVRVLVIDDSSPDGTGELADCLAEELDYVSVLHRPSKEGLGPAYLAGFRRALGDGAEVDRLEHPAVEALEAAGEVVEADAEEERRVQRAAARDDPARDPPVAVDAAARDVA